MAHTVESSRILLRDLVEPESYFSKIVTDRRSKFWHKGTGTFKQPILVAIPSEDVDGGDLLIYLQLRWNFLGTRLEKLIPANRILKIKFQIREF